MPQTVTRKQVAAMFGITERSVDRWAATGKLNPIKVSRRLTRFSLREVQRLLVDAGANPLDLI